MISLLYPRSILMPTSELRHGAHFTNGTGTRGEADDPGGRARSRPGVNRNHGAARHSVCRRGEEGDDLGEVGGRDPSAVIAARFAGVSRIEGATALTQISSSTVSWASAWVSAATADLAAV